MSGNVGVRVDPAGHHGQAPQVVGCFGGIRIDPDDLGAFDDEPNVAESKKNTDVTPDISQIVLDYSADKKITINKNDVTVPELETRLRNIFDQRKDKTMFIIAAGTLHYKDIVEVIDAAKGAGVEKVGIVTEGMRRAGGVSGSN